MPQQHHEDLSEAMQAFENAIESFTIDTLSQFLLRILRNRRLSPYNLFNAVVNALSDFGIPPHVEKKLDEMRFLVGNSSEPDESDEDGE